MIKKMFMAILGSIALVAGLFVGAGSAAAAPTVPVGPGTGFYPQGGVPIAQAGCTINSVGRDSANRLVAITAGHCLQNLAPGTPVFKTVGQQQIGTVTANKAYTPPAGGGIITPPSQTTLDYGVLQLDENVVIPSRVSESGRLTTASVGDAGLFQIGCKEGISTGHTCGLIIGQGPIHYNTFGVSGPGDSGAPFVVGTKLVGLTVGINPSTGQFQYNKITPVLAAINANGGVGAGFTLVP